MSTPPVNSCNSSAGLIEKYINSAYDNVKAVADNLDYLDQIYQFLLRYGLITNIAIKAPVQAVAISPITLSGNQVLTWSAHSGDYTLLATTGMRVLVLGQTNPVENGIYDVQNNAWTRSVDFDGPKDVVDGTLVFSSQGNVWQVDGPQYSLVPGTDPIVFRDIDLFAYEALRKATEKAQEAAASAAAAVASENAAKTSEMNSKDSELAAEAARNQIQQIINDAGEQSTLVALAQPTGAGKSGYNIGTTYPENTIGKKLNFLLSPWDFGAIADGTLHPLSERYASLALAQVDYPFVTSLTQSIDYAATQKCVNEMITRGSAGMTMGGRGRFCINETVQVNKTGSVNEANKYIDFSGAEICSFGGNVILNDTTFSGWSLQNGVSMSDSKLVFAGTSAAQAKATITLTGLTVGKSYAVSVVTEEYTSSGYLRIRLNGGGISFAGEAGPGVRYAEFTATATSHVIELQDDTYNTVPTVCTVKEVDVRELFYPIRFYQTGTSIIHGSMLVNNLRIVNKNSAVFGGIRCEDLNHARFTGVTGIDGFYGPAVHMLNMKTWSENNTIEYLKSANNREAIRFSRPLKGTGLNSFARTQIDRIIISGNRYAFVCDRGCSVYDSVIGPISGNLAGNFRAIFSLHGDQTDTLAESVRVENNAAPASSGIFEYGINDLRRLFLGNVGAYTGVKLVADGSFSAGVISNENEVSNRDFRPAVPRFNTVLFLEKSGALGTGLTYSAGTYMWSEILLNCTPGTAYNIGTSKGLAVNHGVVEIDAALRKEDGSPEQGTKYTTKILKGQVFSSDASKVVVYEAAHVIGAESLATTWVGNSAPSITLTASANRSIQIFARWTV